MTLRSILALHDKMDEVYEMSRIPSSRIVLRHISGVCNPADALTKPMSVKGLLRLMDVRVPPVSRVWEQELSAVPVELEGDIYGTSDDLECGVEEEEMCEDGDEMHGGVCAIACASSQHGFDELLFEAVRGDLHTLCLLQYIYGHRNTRSLFAMDDELSLC